MSLTTDRPAGPSGTSWAGRGRWLADRPRRVLFLLLVVGTALRGTLAAATYGSNDVTTFDHFAAGAVAVGPWRVYSYDFGPGYLYNHGPLTSWLLLLLGHLHDAGVSFPLLIRLPATLADIATTLLIFALVRRSRGQGRALAAAGLFALAPTAIIVAGYHGNTDPVFVMLVLLAAWCLATGRPGWVVGVAVALALSIKVVPIVVLPFLLWLALRRSRPYALSLIAGGAVVFLVLWAPVLVVAPKPFFDNVLGYTGVEVRQWGLSQLAGWAGVPTDTVVTWGNHLRQVPVVLAAATPFVVQRLRPAVDGPSLVALPLAVFLFLTPAFGMQYLVWGLAACLIVAPIGFGAAYAGFSSVFCWLVYSRWSHAQPWHWNFAAGAPFPGRYLPVMVAAWVALGVACAASILGRRRDPDQPSTQVSARVAVGRNAATGPDLLG